MYRVGCTRVVLYANFKGFEDMRESTWYEAFYPRSPLQNFDIINPDSNEIFMSYKEFKITVDVPIERVYIYTTLTEEGESK
ncbi:MAG: hypothetical protein CMH22_05165 [Methylophaga sp.]|nr:hypothetical protein [Methylophaga sp.]MAX51347.1 hypothetical protein [Methylophaga sp.]|tara:strand:+ start:21364 stop:21606 length:243 start_codon:yes stop_codon:yes gene_type:complete